VQVRKKGVHQPIASELFFDLSGNLIKKVNSLEKQMEREEFDDTEETEENQGQISSTNQQVDPKELPGLIISYVKKNYISAKYKIISSEMKEDKNQRPVYYLQIKEKGESKNITELFFDISGKFIKKITPLEKQMEREEFDDTEDIKTLEKEEDTPEEIFSTSQQVNPKELPGLIISYVKKNYISAKYKIISSEMKEDKNQRPIYYLQIKEKGASKNITELFFDISGKFIKKITPLEKQMEREEFDDTEDIKTLEKEEDTPEEIFSTSQQVNPKELPGLIISYVKKNYISAKYKIISSEIKEDKNQRPIYYLQIKEKGASKNITELFFDISGKFIKKITPLEKQMEREEFDDTEDIKTLEKEEDTPEEIFSTSQQVNPKELPGLIISYVKKNYISAKYKIISSEIKEDKNQRPIYYLQIKEKGASKNITELFFDISGKFIKKITPLEKQMQGEEFDDE
jgi:hypothetical protein